MKTPAISIGMVLGVILAASTCMDGGSHCSVPTTLEGSVLVLFGALFGTLVAFGLSFAASMFTARIHPLLLLVVLVGSLAFLAAGGDVLQEPAKPWYADSLLLILGSFGLSVFWVSFAQKADDFVRFALPGVAAGYFVVITVGWLTITTLSQSF